MYEINCRFFNGYKPCEKNTLCNQNCSYREIVKTSIVIVHLGAMGAVLRSTALLKMIKKKYPCSQITWITEDHSKPLLENNKYVDRVLGLSVKDFLILNGLSFDIGYFIDKSVEIAGIRKLVNPKQSYGFTMMEKTGAIIPINAEASELWELGLNNHKKFYINRKSELELIAQSLQLNYSREEYNITLSTNEYSTASLRRREWSDNGRKIIIGLNTGTSGVLKHKTIPIESWKKFIKSYQNNEKVSLVLLGGSLEEQDHEILAKNSAVFRSPNSLGLRDGLCSVEAVDIVVTGDSLGMHMAIGLKKKVVAWFGPSCSQEIDLYDRGIKVISQFSCSPCWKKTCSELVKCNEKIDLALIAFAIKTILISIQMKSRFQPDIEIKNDSPLTQIDI